jgi:Tol biopolymer transport system component/tRNA A-37 threonylcarbamoyl transferase component Bud32
LHLSAGTLLGPYEIVSLLGAGGMGEVYEARDTRLKRRVAVKILPSRVAADSAARERFVREAHAISALNHPNVCTLHDVGSDNGVDYLVMELVEGDSLAEVIGRGPLGLDDVVRLGAQIAGALAKAHSRGIIHRDLKPGNVMITRSGAKLLDFGLARRSEELPAAATDAETAVNPLTADGQVVGTLQYMAPEQLRGGAADARSDIYALGLVLFEMATGRRASGADTDTAALPPALQRLVRKCLWRDPDQRWQCADDVAVELRTPPGETPPPRSEASGWRRGVTAMIAAVALIVGAAAAALLLSRRQAVPATPMQFSITGPREMAMANPLRWSPVSVSPDGMRVAIVGLLGGQRYLWVRDLASAEAKRLEGTAGAQAPFWSPDGKSIGYFADGAVRAVAVDSGAASTICPMDVTVPNGTWGSDGTILFGQVAGDRGIFAVPSSGGRPRRLNVGDTLPAHLTTFLPDGKRFFFVSLKGGVHTLYVGFLDGSPPRPIGAGVGRLAYVPPYLVYSRDGTLVARRFDEAALRFSSEPVPIAPSVASFVRLGISAHDAGRKSIVYVPNARSARLVWFDRKGSQLATAGSVESYWRLRLSPDAKRVLATVGSSAGNNDVWTIDAARNLSTRVTFGDHYETAVWSPDGKSFAFTADVQGPPSLFVRPIASAQRQPVTRSGQLQQAESWIPGTDRILYTVNDRETQADLMVASVSTRQSVVWLRTPFNERGARASPDGAWVAYVSDDSGRDEVYVEPLDHSRERVRVSGGGGSKPAWRGDGRELFYLTASRELFAAPINVTGGALTSGDAVPLFTFVQEISDYDVARDGQRILAIVVDQNPSTQPVSVIVGWQELVEKALANH